MTEPIFGGDEVGQAPADTATVAVIPAPLESTVSYGGGTEHGPAGLLRASCELEFFDEELGAPYPFLGRVHTTPPVAFTRDADGTIDGEAAVHAIRDRVTEATAHGAWPLLIGGEHTVTLGAVQALAARDPDFGVVFVDAHLDLRDRYTGTPWSHACVARRLIEAGHRVDWCGIRSVSQEEAEFVAAHGLAPRYAHQIVDDRERSWIAPFVASLPPRVYLTLDVDGLDPAVIPGTGTPEPGGLDYRTVLALIRELTRERTLVGADIVELAPIPGQQGSEFTAAKLAAKLLAALPH